MREYLCSFFNGKKSLAISQQQTVIVFKLNNETVYPILVDETAVNALPACCKISGAIKHFSFIAPVLNLLDKTYYDSDVWKSFNIEFEIKGGRFLKELGIYVLWGSVNQGNGYWAYSYDGINWTTRIINPSQLDNSGYAYYLQILFIYVDGNGNLCVLGQYHWSRGYDNYIFFFDVSYTSLGSDSFTICTRANSYSCTVCFDIGDSVYARVVKTYTVCLIRIYKSSHSIIKIKDDNVLKIVYNKTKNIINYSNLITDSYVKYYLYNQTTNTSSEISGLDSSRGNVNDYEILLINGKYYFSSDGSTIDYTIKKSSKNASIVGSSYEIIAYNPVSGLYYAWGDVVNAIMDLFTSRYPMEDSWSIISSISTGRMSCAPILSFSKQSYDDAYVYS